MGGVRELIVHRTRGLGRWRLTVAGGCSIKRGVGPVEARSEPAKEETPYRTPQYEALLRRRARMREESLRKELFS